MSELNNRLEALRILMDEEDEMGSSGRWAEAEAMALLLAAWRAGRVSFKDEGGSSDLSFAKIWQEHEDWSYDVFGGPDVKGPIGPIKHLGKEQKELLENPDDPSEYADCMFLIMDAARRQGLGLQGLLKAMADKQRILWARDYRADPNNPDEPVEHQRS